MEYTVLFFTHSGAIKFNRKLKSKSIKCELMPVPRALSSNCSISAKIFFNDDIKELIDDEVEKIFITENNKKELVYESE
ncbi:DUF3343 domain-containing protein [Clostridium sp. 'deep sea']|uniref:DUF3343 domain-containing protein n=1 Tax=Clostridium sp. 'deep sea' TaxID=2779445 RepID=UPI0018966490|nr:DUF3343 domain-containing protein [Clostridium sp. 'deep sea']QOR35208.1 DUF3343 domain-containing protein [Clostridium sp. 'deep sea']